VLLRTLPRWMEVTAGALTALFVVVGPVLVCTGLACTGLACPFFVAVASGAVSSPGPWSAGR